MNFTLEKINKLEQTIKSFSSTLTSGTIENKRHLVDFRTLYLEEFNKGNNIKDFLQEKIKQFVKNNNINTDLEEEKLIITSNFGSLEIKPYTAYFIGRHECNDLIIYNNYNIKELNQNTKEYTEHIKIINNFLNISRIQCIIFFIPTSETGKKIKGKLRVLDFWSLSGTELDIPHLNYPSIKSIPNNRKLIELDIYQDNNYSLNFCIHNSQYKFKFQMKYLKNETKECIVCMSRLRDIIFDDCNHHICCKFCYLKIKNGSNKCPTCNKIIDTVTENNISFNNFKRKLDCINSYAIEHNKKR